MKIIKVRIVVTFFAFLIISSLSHNAKADTFKDMEKNEKHFYKGCIFAVSDLTSDGKSEIIAQIPGKQNLSILRWNGIWFRKLGEIETPFEKINDVAVGDVDNDGTDEIALVSGKELYIFERKDNKFALDTTKTTPLYGEKRFGKKEVLEATKKFIEHLIVEFKGSDEEIIELDFESCEGKLIRIGDVNNDGNNELIVSKKNESPYQYTVDILKWKEEYFEVTHSYPLPDSWPGNLSGLGDSGIIIDDLNTTGINRLIYSGKYNFSILEYYKTKNIFQHKVSCYITPWGETHDQRITVGTIDSQKVLVYSIFEKSEENWVNNKWANNSIVNIVYLNSDIFPQLSKPAAEKIEDRIIRPDAFAPGGRLAPRHVTEKLKGIEGFVIGDLDSDQENELIVNVTAGAYIYGLKFNVALIVTIIIGAILIIALAVFLFIRTKRKKKAFI